MNQLFRVDRDAQNLLDMIYAPMYTKVLFAAIEMDLFSQMEEPMTAAELAEKLNLHPKNTARFLDALTGMTLLEKQRGLYRNSAAANKYLVLGREWYLGEFLIAYHYTTGYEGISLTQLVREGPETMVEEMQRLEAFEAFGDMNEIMKSIQRGGRSREISEMVSALPEFPGFRKMLDLGGGVGLLGMSVVRNHPDLKGVIFDTPEAGKAAGELIAENCMEERMEVLTGDYRKDSIGEGYDLILAIGTLNFAKHEMEHVIRKVYDALNPGGVFLSISDGLNQEGTSPGQMVVSWLPSALRGFDFSLQQGEVSEAALRNGFRSVYKQTVPMLTGPMDVDIIRK